MGSCISTNEFKDVTYNNTVSFIPPIHKGKVIKVYDGDTFTIAAKLKGISKSTFYRFPVRIKHIDCPELRTQNKEEKEIALLAKEKLHSLIFGKVVELHSTIYDKYGRLCCDVYINKINVGEYMLQHGLAVHYEGGTKISPQNWKTYYTNYAKK